MMMFCKLNMWETNDYHKLCVPLCHLIQYKEMTYMIILPQAIYCSQEAFSLCSAFPVVIFILLLATYFILPSKYKR